MKSKRRSAAERQRRAVEIDEVAIRLHIKALREGGHLATSPAVPGLVAEARSIAEATEIAQGPTRKIVESCFEHGDPLPPNPHQTTDPFARIALPRGHSLMGPLSGFKYCEDTRRLRACGFVFDRQGPGSHDARRLMVSGRKVTVPHHAHDTAEGTRRAILPEAGIDFDDFLTA
jgi:antitoxin HicB